MHIHSDYVQYISCDDNDGTAASLQEYKTPCNYKRGRLEHSPLSSADRFSNDDGPALF
jgi:hypothetical protein